VSGIVVIELVGREMRIPSPVGHILRELFFSSKSVSQLGYTSNAIFQCALEHPVPIIQPHMKLHSNHAGVVITDMHDRGLLGADNIFNHCTRLTDSEWRLLRAAGAHVTVNPRSDALFGFEAGGMPFQTAIDYGLKPALGVDVDTSMSGDMFAEMRIAFFLQRSIAQTQRVIGKSATPAAVTVRAILEAATVNSAACLGLADQIGTLTPGKQADIIAIRTDGIAVYPSHNAVGTVVHMVDRADVQEVMVAGRLRKHAGRLLDVDVARLHAETDTARARLFEVAGAIE